MLPRLFDLGLGSWASGTDRRRRVARLLNDARAALGLSHHWVQTTAQLSSSTLCSPLLASLHPIVSTAPTSLSTGSAPRTRAIHPLAQRHVEAPTRQRPPPFGPYDPPFLPLPGRAPYQTGRRRGARRRRYLSVLRESGASPPLRVSGVVVVVVVLNLFRR
jgi:hypothetical protein